MAERCTCGVVLVEDALFCHKCGRPLRDDLIARDIVETVTSVAQQQPPPPPLPAAAISLDDIGFHNPVAVRIALLVAAVSFFLQPMLGLVPFGNFLQLPMLLFVGTAGVFFYRRRTGVALSPMSGARLGWLIGLFCFVFILVVLAFGAVSAVAGKISVADMLKQASQANPQAKAQFDQMGDADIASLILLVLASIFVLLTVVPTIGGLLGSKLMRPRNNP